MARKDILILLLAAALLLSGCIQRSTVRSDGQYGLWTYCAAQSACITIELTPQRLGLNFGDAG